MTKKLRHIEDQLRLSRKTEEMISGTRIAWQETVDEVWNSMEGKLGDMESELLYKSSVNLLFIKYAAAIIFAILSGFLVISHFHAVKVSSGSKMVEITLPDNSGVTLYPNSYLSYKPLIWNVKRKVKFQGEGIFSVEKGSTFEVVSKMGCTTVLGTKFKVYARKNDYIVTCISGKVQVSESKRINSAVITKNEQAILRTDGKFDIKKLNEWNDKSAREQKSSVETINELQEQSDREVVTAKSEQKDVSSQQNGNSFVSDNPIHTIPEDNNMSNVQNNRDFNTGNAETKPERGVEEKDIVKEQNADKPVVEETVERNNTFQSSLTPEQITILENQQLSREERRQAFLESLSPQQQQLFNVMREERVRQQEFGSHETGSEGINGIRQGSQRRETIKEESAINNTVPSDVRQTRDRRQSPTGGEVQKPSGNNKPSQPSNGGERTEQPPERDHIPVPSDGRHEEPGVKPPLPSEGQPKPDYNGGEPGNRPSRPN